MTERSPLSWFLIWLACFCVLAVVFGQGLSDVLSLKNHHAETSGAVIDVQERNHYTIVVRYQVNRIPFTGTFQYGPRVKTGDSVTVYYSPADPKNAAITLPSEVWDQRLGFDFLITLVMSLVSTTGIFRLDASNRFVARTALAGSPLTTRRWLLFGWVRGLFRRP